jgi:murein DD-endopeptidase MepM/ murein hydrolase activator NlpD
MTIAEVLPGEHWTKPPSAPRGLRARSHPCGKAAEFLVEPPIEADGRRGAPIDRRRLSSRWLAGTILTCVCGAGLMGAAVHATLGNRLYFAEPATRVPALHKDLADDSGINPRKADRLVQPVDIVAAKRTFRAPTAIRFGEKEVMKVRNFTRVETTLLLSDAGLGEEVPPFNPLKVLADTTIAAEPAPEPIQDDAEVSWATRDFPKEGFSTAIVLTMEEVQDQVAEHVRNIPQPGAQSGAKPMALPPQLLLMRTSRADLAGILAYANPTEPISAVPFSSIEVRMVPENVTYVVRSPQTAAASEAGERLVVVHHGESLETVLRAANVPTETIAAIAAALGTRRGEVAVPEGRRLKLQFADLDGNGTGVDLVRLSVYSDETLETVVAIDDSGAYVPVTSPRRTARRPVRSAEGDEEEGGLRLYDSLYATALKQEIPRPIIDDLVRVFANDVDLQRPVRGGDSFEAFYDEGDEGEGHGQLLYAKLTARDETSQFYRFQTPDDGVVDFYDQNGRSARKFLVRTPISAGRFTSGFGNRFHPILGYTRPHTGVDWAAPMGTPIFAAGHGTIISAGWDSGYGRRIEIQHANGYVTTYNHLSGFARGVKEGAKVRQGQVVGYLGRTGLATGPHLHYEILVNGHFVDPMRVKLARTREFDGRMLASFRREQDRIDGLIAKAPTAERIEGARLEK